jgi:hypothetical protein
MSERLEKETVCILVRSRGGAARGPGGGLCVCVCVLVKKYAGVSVTSNLHFPLLLLLQNE